MKSYRSFSVKKERRYFCFGTILCCEDSPTLKFLLQYSISAYLYSLIQVILLQKIFHSYKFFFYDLSFRRNLQYLVSHFSFPPFTLLVEFDCDVKAND